MNVNMQIGFGGFLSLAFDHIVKGQTVAVVIRFGVGAITIYLDGERRTMQEMKGPQSDYTVDDLTNLVYRARQLADLWVK